MKLLVYTIQFGLLLLLQYSTLEDIEREREKPIQDINDDVCWFLCQLRHQTVKWVFLWHFLYTLTNRTGNTNARLPFRHRAYIAFMWLRLTIILFICMYVSIYAFLICRWLKRKSPVAYKLLNICILWCICEWHATTKKDNRKCATHTLTECNLNAIAIFHKSNATTVRF